MSHSSSSYAPVIHSIDVGFGNTKFTTSGFMSGFGCDFIPSLAPLANPVADRSKGIMSTADTITVKIGNTNFIVGKDARNEATTTSVRILESDFPLSETYHALVKGALYQIGAPKIDVLMLGLPMNTYDLHRSPLRKKMIGVHIIPNPSLKKNNGIGPVEMSVEVENVLVVPQPVGAFNNYAVPLGLTEKMQNQINLTIDIGHGTFDWYVARGNHPMSKRCGACFGGVSKIITALANAENAALKENLHMIYKIEDALPNRSEIKIKGKEVDLFAKHSDVMNSTIRETISTMISGIGDLDDIDNILVTGGGAHLFFPELQKRIPGHQLICDTDPIFSNVKGFQMLGETWWRNQTLAA